jgi:hypothetical protein
VRNESLMWRKLRPVLTAAKLDPVRVENPVHPGTPDVNLADGRWIELKCILAWPARETSQVRIQHFTPQQRVWLYRRWKYAPGSTYLLLKIREDQQWLLFDGDVAAKIVGQSTRSEHRTNARAVLAERSIGDLPKILSERDPAGICTGSLVHDPYTLCPVHDASGAR